MKKQKRPTTIDKANPLFMPARLDYESHVRAACREYDQAIGMVVEKNIEGLELVSSSNRYPDKNEITARQAMGKAIETAYSQYLANVGMKG